MTSLSPISQAAFGDLGVVPSSRDAFRRRNDPLVKLKKSSLFALYAVYELGRRPERRIAAGEIAEKYGVSEHHVAKVLQQLSRAGLVEGTRGLKGGFRLARAAGEITMFEIVEIFEPRSALRRERQAVTEPEPEGGRRIREVLDEVEDQAYYTLQSISLSTLISPKRLA